MFVCMYGRRGTNSTRCECKAEGIWTLIQPSKHTDEWIKERPYLFTESV